MKPTVPVSKDADPNLITKLKNLIDAKHSTVIRELTKRIVEIEADPIGKQAALLDLESDVSGAPNDGDIVPPSLSFHDMKILSGDEISFITINRAAIDRSKVDSQYPTDHHTSEFWEELGRTVATFGYLEETLAKAVFSLTATVHHEPDDIEAEYAKWIVKLERTISDQLGALINSYENALNGNSESSLINPTELITNLRDSSQIRNVLCHGSWKVPDQNGKSIPFFVNKKLEVFLTPIDVKFLKQTRSFVVDLIFSVIDSVTHMGWQFPGGGGPGEVILKSRIDL